MLSLLLIGSLLFVHTNSATVTAEDLSTSDLIVTTARDIQDDHDGNGISLPDDVIELNIGGQKITTLRSTLTVIPNSKLAQMFTDKDLEMKLARDKDGAFFFDYNPMYFNFLIDQLRAIKRQPKRPGYQWEFQAPYINSQTNFTHMLVDFGLTPNDFLFPMEGTHLNLSVKALAGWQECHRSAYAVPFNFSILHNKCNGSRLLVACRSVQDKNTLTLAGIGQYEDVLHPCLPKRCQTNSTTKKRPKKLHCSSSYQCMTQAKRGVGWYNANNQTLGFVRGSLSFSVNPCDASSLDADYRLCWTGATMTKNGFGDRCGSVKNLQDSTEWERLIYSIA